MPILYALFVVVRTACTRCTDLTLLSCSYWMHAFVLGVRIICSGPLTLMSVDCLSRTNLIDGNQMRLLSKSVCSYTGRHLVCQSAGCTCLFRFDFATAWNLKSPVQSHATAWTCLVDLGPPASRFELCCCRSDCFLRLGLGIINFWITYLAQVRIEYCTWFRHLYTPCISRIWITYHKWIIQIYVSWTSHLKMKYHRWIIQIYMSCIICLWFAGRTWIVHINVSYDVHYWFRLETFLRLQFGALRIKYVGTFVLSTYVVVPSTFGPFVPSDQLRFAASLLIESKKMCLCTCRMSGCPLRSSLLTASVLWDWKYLVCV